MDKTSIEALNELGQSAWLDNISHLMIRSGALSEMIAKGLRGVTSNPSIFNKSIASTSDYNSDIAALFSQGKTTFEIYDELTTRDIRGAADLFLTLYEKTQGLDGYISLEVNPKLAFDVEATIVEAKRLKGKVNRPNVMFKIPATAEGIKVVEELIALGININATLIFSLAQYAQTALAYIRGIARFIEGGGSAQDVRSVASVFISRIDTVCDKRLDALLSETSDNEKNARIQSLKGKAAVANTAIVYQKYLKLFSLPEFLTLREKGANVQRVLWGSTSTKDPGYSDIKYVTELIAKDSVNTIPQATFDAFLDHGEARIALGEDAFESEQIITQLSNLSIDITQVCQKLLLDGVIAFEKAFDELLAAIDEKAKVLCKR